MMYWEMFDVLESLLDGHAKMMLKAIRNYSQYGEIPDFTGYPMLSTLWMLVKPKVDADAERYERTIEQRRNAGKVSAAKRLAEANDCQQIQPTTTTTTATTTAEYMAPPAALPTPPEQQKDKPVRHKHGQYGWIRLSEKEYSRLSNDLGEAELKRCIAYVDEAAQSTGNKNKWRDWNLVLRRCHRDGWGVGKTSAKQDKPFVYNPGDTSGSL